MRRIDILFLAAVALFCADELCAYNEALSFRAGPAGTINAVVSGTAPSGFCSSGKWSYPHSVSINGETISLLSDDSGLCGIPGPDAPYDVVVNLGVLPLPQYQVSWSTGMTTLTAVVQPSAVLNASAIPTVSPVALILMGISIVASAFSLIRSPR